MRWTIRHRKADGTVEVTHHGDVNGGAPRKHRGCPVLRSLSRGVSVMDLEAAKRLDQQLGVSDEYEVRGPIAYKVFNSPADERAWNRAHHRVDHNAGYRDPVPGDFVGRD